MDIAEIYDLNDESIGFDRIGVISLSCKLNLMFFEDSILVRAVSISTTFGNTMLSNILLARVCIF